ncbi:hypothetical protein CMV_004460 [Castanea mollissima]|uniref:Uncharacterized protein n=1 Tax=Castanea mollissima TaxID=60419 RepID=A0A8J4RQ16_9ROSI|nr:hypothetical protein CMV_004460 [Castanea mollissima]
MATPSLSQASLFQPKPSLLNPNTLQNQNANSRLFAHHNHLSITLPLKTRNGLVSNPKASLTVQPNVNSTVPIKNCDSPIVVIDKYASFTYNPEVVMRYIFPCYAMEKFLKVEFNLKENTFGMNPRGILISPRPGVPQDSGISLQTVL